jgi:hypothetical protein
VSYPSPEEAWPRLAAVRPERRTRTPWRESILDRARDLIRFCLGVSMAINFATICIFSILFTYEFLDHAWKWCLRTMFAKDW